MRTYTHSIHMRTHAHMHACMGAQAEAADGVASNALLHCSLPRAPQHMERGITLEEDDWHTGPGKQREACQCKLNRAKQSQTDGQKHAPLLAKDAALAPLRRVLRGMHLYMTCMRVCLCERAHVSHACLGAFPSPVAGWAGQARALESQERACTALATRGRRAALPVPELRGYRLPTASTHLHMVRVRLCAKPSRVHLELGVTRGSNTSNFV